VLYEHEKHAEMSYRKITIETFLYYTL